MAATETNAQQKQPLFRDLNPDDADPETTTIESVCINCYKDGVTRLLLTKIPFYKEVVLMSFSCEHCGFQNNEIQSAGEIQVKGCRITVTVSTVEDLNRKVVKSDYASVSIPEVELEIPSQSQKGEITTIEGIIDRAVAGLSQDQEARRRDHPESSKLIDDYIQKLENLKNVSVPFTIIIEDISGNSFVENPVAPQTDPNSKIQHFNRTTEQDNLLGLYAPAPVEAEDAKDNHLLKPIPEGSWPLEELHGEVLQFQTNCPQCSSPCETNMKVTSIPHFKDVVIMATVCEVCGNKTNEVKSGGGIEEQAVKIEVLVSNKDDLTRDVLKSDTCSMSIPELECEVGQGALGGRFTTVEGILVAMKDQLQENGSLFHDSADEKTRERFRGFIAKIDDVITLKRPATLVLDDPAGNSYVQSLSDDGPDDKLKITKYDRSFEQNEELGLNDMKTENY